MWRNRCFHRRTHPVAKASGDEVIGASLNRSGSFIFSRHPHSAATPLLAQIV